MEKKCTNCSRSVQPLSEFINVKGIECKRCKKCRDKDQKNSTTEKRRTAHNKLQNEKKYYRAWREKKRTEDEDKFKEHNSEVHVKWKENNPSYIAEWSRHSVNSRLYSIKRSATKREIAWELDDEIAKDMLTKPCVYCGHLDLKVRVNGIDRMDSFGSYSKDNCVPCCKGCNFMKCNYDSNTFINRCKQIAQCSYEFPLNIKTFLENRFPLKLNGNRDAP